MKWIAVILAMVNLVVFLLMKAYPTSVEIIPEADFQAINEDAMSVVLPETKDTQASVEAPGVELEEDDLAQLKVDNRGQVLMARKQDIVADKKPVVSARPVPVAKQVLEKQEAEAMPVLKPLDRRKNAQVALVPAVTPEIAAVKKPQVVAKAPVKPAPKPVPTPTPVEACFRMGPFSNQNELTTVRHKLDSGSIAYRVEEKTAPGKIKAVRVYLGAFSGEAALAEQKKQLEKMKIEHFVIRLNGDRLIQLGYFSEPARALSYQKKLNARGVAAKTATIYRETNINSWLNIGSTSIAVIDAIKLPRGVQRRKQVCP